MAEAQALAGDRTVEVAAGDVGGQVPGGWVLDEVRVEGASGVLAPAKRFFGGVDAPHLLEDPRRGRAATRVLHLRHRVRR